MRTWVQSLASISGLRMQHCRELWYRSQAWFGFGSGVAVALIRPLVWKLPQAVGEVLKRQKKKKKKKRKRPKAMECVRFLEGGKGKNG